MELKVREWTLYEEIGRGGMGVVYRATHGILKGEFAVKVVLPQYAEDTECRQRFLAEAMTLAELRHPNIIQVRDPFQENAHLYLPMELLKGQSLEKELKASPGQWDPARAVGVVAQAAAGIGHGHRQDPPVLHRDIKPGNIFVLSDGRVKVLDFGLARTLGDKSMTATGKAVGTPAYMAPEVLDGRKATPRSDVYGLGIVLYRLLAGRLPYDMPEEDSSVQAIFMAVARGIERGLPDIRQFVPGLPAALADMTMRALSRDPPPRPADAAEFAQLLTALDLSGRQTATAVPAPQPDSDRTEIGIDLLAGRRRIRPPDTEPDLPPEVPAFDRDEDWDLDLRYNGFRKPRGIVMAFGLLAICLACMAVWWFGFEAPSRAADEASCGQARQQETSAGWQSYLEQYPKGTCREEGANALADLDACESARSAGTVDGWRGYLSAHPDGRCAGEAKTIIDDADACANARRIGTAEIWRAYLARAVSSGGAELSCEEEASSFLNSVEAAIEWVRIEGGTFQMGTNDCGPYRVATPVHTVTLPAFEMAKTEVTNAQYMKCVAAGACTAPHWDDGKCSVTKSFESKDRVLPQSFRGDAQPVVCVDWNQAAAFAKWVGGRLPTEAEWEYAARSGGREQKYPWGNRKATCSYAVVFDGTTYGCGRDCTWPVCSKVAGNTSHGLCDMSGNVRELVQDEWGHDYSRAPSNGSALVVAHMFPVLRGGAWNFDDSDLFAACRDYSFIDSRESVMGFRVARSVR